MRTEGERVILDYDEAVAMLPEGEYVHTFRNPGAGMMIGCDHGRASLLEKIKEHGAELSGQMATGMSHGLVLFDDHGPLFIETRKEEVPADA